MNTIIITITLLLYFHTSVLTQWQQDIRLTNATGSCGGFQGKFAVSGNALHVVFDDSRTGNFEIYHKSSFDRGLTWIQETRLTVNPYRSEHPTVAVSGETVHVVWQYYEESEPFGNVEIYYIRSTNSGATWEQKVRLTNDPASAGGAFVAVNDSIVFVAWTEFRHGPPEIYFKRSVDGGVNWSPDIRLTNDPGPSYEPVMAVRGSVIHISWYDSRDGNLEIYYKRSYDNGLTWGADKRITNDPWESANNSITVGDSLDVHLCWADDRNGIKVYYKRSIDDGLTWGNEFPVSDLPGTSYRPHIVSSGLNLHAVWMNLLGGNDEIYYKKSTDKGITWGENVRLTNDISASWLPSVRVTDSVVHVVWIDSRDGNLELYYKRNPTGNPIGITEISSEIPERYSLSQNYPNPFNPVTGIKFELPNSGFVDLTIFDLLGRKVETLVNEELKAGSYNAEWNASNYTSGVYFYRFEADGFHDTKKMMLVK